MMKTTQTKNYQSLACVAALTMTFGATGLSEAYASTRSPSTDSSPVTLEVVEESLGPHELFPLATFIAGFEIGMAVGAAAAKWWYGGSAEPHVGNPIMTPELPSKVTPSRVKTFFWVKAGGVPSSYDSEAKLARATPEFLLDS